MKKARKVGVSYVGIKNSGHYGASGSYAVEAAEKGFIAISLSNTLCNMNVPGAKGALIGNSPFCYAIPVPSRHPVCLDIATSTAAAMKVLQVEARGGECPPDWIVDNDGNPITKPENGNWILSPIGGHKGYGISFLIEVLCAALSGGNVLNVGLWTIPEIVPEVSHSFILIDVAQITSLEDFSLRMLNAIHQLENAEPTVPGQKVYAPGDPAWENYDRATLLGLDLPDNIVHNMSLLAQETGLDLATCCAE